MPGNTDPRELAEQWLEGPGPGHRGKSTAAATIAAYRTDVRHFLDWAEENGVDPLTAGDGDIGAFVEDRRQTQGDSQASATRRLVGVGAFYKWLIAEGHVTGNPTLAHGRDFGTPASSAPQLSPKQAGAILAAADAAGPLEAAIVYLMLEAGAGVGVILAGCGPYITGLPRTPELHVAVDGDDHVIGMPPATWQRLRAYLQDAGRFPLPAVADSRGGLGLFILPGGKALYRNWLDRMIKKVAVAAGVSNAAELRPQSLPATYRALQTTVSGIRTKQAAR